VRPPMPAPAMRMGSLDTGALYQRDGNAEDAKQVTSIH
jgi:hypothetical protein